MSFLKHLVDRGTRTLAASAGLVPRAELLDLEEIVEITAPGLPGQMVVAKAMPQRGVTVRAAADPVTTPVSRGEAALEAALEAARPGDQHSRSSPAPRDGRASGTAEPREPLERQKPQLAREPETPVRQAVAAVEATRPPGGIAPEVHAEKDAETNAQASAEASVHFRPMAGAEAPWRGAGIRSVEAVTAVTAAPLGDLLAPQEIHAATPQDRLARRPAQVVPGGTSGSAVAVPGKDGEPDRSAGVPRPVAEEAAVVWRELGRRLLATHPPASPLRRPGPDDAPADSPKETHSAGELVVESLEVQVMAPTPAAAPQPHRHAPDRRVAQAGAWDSAVRHYVSTAVNP